MYQKVPANSAQQSARPHRPAFLSVPAAAAGIPADSGRPHPAAPASAVPPVPDPPAPLDLDHAPQVFPLSFKGLQKNADGLYSFEQINERFEQAVNAYDDIK